MCKRTISNELHRHRLKSRSSRKNPLLKKIHIKFRLDFAKTYTQCSDDFFKQRFWPGAGEDRTAYSQKNTIHTMKYGGRNIMV